MFTSVPDVVIAAAADHRRELLDDAAQHRLARLARRARRRARVRGRRRPAPAPDASSCPGRPLADPGVEVPRHCRGRVPRMTDVARLGVGIELVGRRASSRR